MVVRCSIAVLFYAILSSCFPAHLLDAVRTTSHSCAHAWLEVYGGGFDCYFSPSGFEVVLGLNSEANEVLSMEIAKDSDDFVWLHTDDGIPGSHVVIRAPWELFSMPDIVFASRLAATRPR